MKAIICLPPEISRSTRPKNFGPLIHLYKRAKMTPVLIRLPARCVFYRPKPEINIISNFERFVQPIYFKPCKNVSFYENL